MHRIRLTRLAAIISDLEKIAEAYQDTDPVVALALDRVSDALEGRQAFLPPFTKKPVAPKAPEHKAPGAPALVPDKELKEREDIKKQREEHKTKEKSQGYLDVSDHFKNFRSRLDSISEPKFKAIMDRLNDSNLKKQLQNFYNTKLKGKLDEVSFDGLLKEISQIIKGQFSHYESELEGISGKAFQDNLKLALPPILSKEK